MTRKEVIPAAAIPQRSSSASAHPPSPDMQLAIASTIKSGTSNALIQFATGSTLLPPQLAELVTNLSALARVSLRATAFFIQVILEAAKHSTNLSLGLTRRALISAIGSARAMHAIAGGEMWDPRSAGETVRKFGQATNEAFLSVLDRYTALGIYVIHHSFTMAELFAMSGFYLTSTTLQAGIGAADESVRIIDGIFGSNETSRALSGFISLVRRELADDDDDDEAQGIAGNIRALASLTKAFTAFAILQNATYRRSILGQQTRVLYDCTVLGQVERDNWRARVVGPGSFLKVSSAEAVEGDASPHPPRSSLYAEEPACLTEVPSRRLSRADDTSIIADLDYLVGDDEESPRSPHPVVESKRLRHDELPDEIRRALAQYDDDDLEGGVVVNRAPSNRNGVRQTVRRMSSRDAVETVYEITTETVETVETTTTTTTTTTLERPAPARRANLLRIPNLFASRSSTRDTTQSRTGTEQVTRSADGLTEVITTEEEDEWCEVQRTAPVPPAQQRLARTLSSDSSDEVERALPQVPNGLPADGALALQHALGLEGDANESTTARMDVVLRTVKRKFTQKKRIVRHVERERGDEGGGSPMAQSRPQSPVRERTAPGKAKAHSTPQMDLGSTFQRALTKARSAVRHASGSKAPSPAGVRSPADHDVAMASVTELEPFPTSEQAMRFPMSEQAAMDTDAPPPPSSERDSVRAKKRRSRKTPSMTSMRSFASRTHTHVTAAGPSGTEASSVGGSFPRTHLVHNLHRFMRYSSGAYGHAFLKIMGMGTSAEYLFANTARHHTNVWSFAHHVGVPVDNVLLSSFTEDVAAPFHSQKLSPVVNFISVDHEAKAIVLTCRGTLGLSDVLTDLTCELEDIEVEGGHAHATYQVHSGMWASAQRFCAPGSVVHATLRRALEERPEYGLVLTGHSLGGGVTALLALLWASPAECFRAQVLQEQRSVRHPRITTRFVTSLASGLPAGRPIHAFAFGVPAVASPDLSKHTRGLVTSVVHANDVVPALSLGTVRDMRNVAKMLADERDSDVAREIVKRVLGFYQRQRARRVAAPPDDVQRLKPAPAPAPAPASQMDFETDSPRAQEAPASAREQSIDLHDLVRGRTPNQATRVGYTDPHTSGGGGGGGEEGHARGATSPLDAQDEDGELNDWLWSLIRTMRANMNEAKLYPPGQVFTVESFEVFVTPRLTPDRRALDAERLAASRGQAHRVILRECADVERRFAEPVFARSMLRDHMPTNYELCTQLLYDAVVAPQDEA